jgi:nitroreductase
MDIFELIKQRHAVRQYSDKKLDEHTIKTILQAGQYAPSPLNSQPWHFTLIRNKENLDALAAKAHHASFISQAQLLIIVTVDTTIDIDHWLRRHNQHLYSGAAAMQNMWLAACALEIGCCWVTLDDMFTKELISIPKEQAIIGGLALGHYKEPHKPQVEKDRKALPLLTSFEKFNLQENCETESCFTCLKLIPKSAANSFEGEDYVRYFCGNECFTEWKKQTQKWLGDKDN